MTGGGTNKNNEGSFFSNATCATCAAWLGELGAEPTPQLYVAHMVMVCKEIWRVLRDDGTFWLNIGDSYCNAGSRNNGTGLDGSRRGGMHDTDGSWKSSSNQYGDMRHRLKSFGIKHKDLLGVPWRLAIALQDEGWYLRNSIIWNKPNAMPSSCRDRFGCAYEYIFLLTKKPRYFFDMEAVKRPIKHSSVVRNSYGFTKTEKDDSTAEVSPGSNKRTRLGLRETFAINDSGANQRNVVTIPVKSYKGSHFATFPPALPQICIKAGTSEKGVCAKCGSPLNRIVQRERKPTRPGVNTKVSKVEECHEGVIDKEVIGNRDPQRHVTVTKTVGWQPTCGCAGNYLPNDFDIIATPTGEKIGDDPTMETGCAGMNRPRGDNEGSRLITRYEQRMYAAQIASSPYGADMRQEVGQAIDHYVRIDLSGARPVPDGVLDAWIAKGWLDRVEPPKQSLPEISPAVVLDPFAGSFTSISEAIKLGRSGIGIELNAQYIELGRKRILDDTPDAKITDVKLIE